MLRTALQPRWIGWLLAVLAVCVAFGWLGLWQLQVAREDAQQEVLREAAARPILELGAVLAPHARFPADGSNQRVQAAGRFEPDRQFVVVERRLGGADGFWVVQPFVVEATGARLPVVRGFVRSLEAAEAFRASTAVEPKGSAGAVMLVGSLAPTESPGDPRRPLPDGQARSIDVGALLNTWQGEIYNAFAFSISETPDARGAGPAGASAAGGLERVPPPELPSGLTLRNAAYALQWWVFAFFGVWMWVKMVRDDYRRQNVGASPGLQQSTAAPSSAGAPQ
ncbi:MAG: SURF1 family protein [Candidatus Phosphoribacter sp.]